MSFASLEREVLAEAREVTGIHKLRLKDILEWTTGDIEPRDDEIIFHLPALNVNIAIAKQPNKDGK